MEQKDYIIDTDIKSKKSIIIEEPISGFFETEMESYYQGILCEQ